jgi:hypothetical protein
MLSNFPYVSMIINPMKLPNDRESSVWSWAGPNNAFNFSLPCGYQCPETEADYQGIDNR